MIQNENEWLPYRLHSDKKIIFIGLQLEKKKIDYRLKSRPENWSCCTLLSLQAAEVRLTSNFYQLFFYLWSIVGRSAISHRWMQTVLEDFQKSRFLSLNLYFPDYGTLLRKTKVICGIISSSCIWPYVIKSIFLIKIFVLFAKGLLEIQRYLRIIQKFFEQICFLILYRRQTLFFIKEIRINRKPFTII